MSNKNYTPRGPYIRGNVIYEHIYEIELYPVSENLQFDVILDRLQKVYVDILYVYAFHDKDLFDDGTPKKPHYHLLFVFPREKSIKKIAHDLEVPEYAIVWKQFLDKSVQYLIHLNNPEKYQYDVEILQGTLDFEQYFASSKRSSLKNELNLITDFIIRHKGHITYYEIFCFARDNDLLNTYRRWYSIIKDIYQE